MIMSWGIPASPFYLTFYDFRNTLGQLKPMMLISLGYTLVHAVLAKDGLAGQHCAGSNQPGGGARDWWLARLSVQAGLLLGGLL